MCFCVTLKDYLDRGNFYQNVAYVGVISGKACVQTKKRKFKGYYKKLTFSCIWLSVITQLKQLLLITTVTKHVFIYAAENRNNRH